MLSVGMPAPKFTLPELAGAARPLEDLLAQGPVLLAFFKISCPVCQFTLPYLERLKESAHVQVIGVSQDDSRATADFGRAFGVSLPVLLDAKADGYVASNAYGITHVPTMFQIEQDGTISHAWSGWSKPDMEALGERAGQIVIRQDEKVPQFKPG
jgi:peroxiredoxin